MLALILVVEDDRVSRDVVNRALGSAGYAVEAVADGEAGVAVAEERRPDLVVLDVNLPGIDGWEVCRRLRERYDVPILFLTGLTDDEHTVKGLQLGGDDYLAKPFSPPVLVARVEALLRRSGNASQRVVRLTGLTIDLTSGEVLQAGRRVTLTATEFRILAALAQQPGQMVSSRELMKMVQGYDLTETEAREIVKVHVRHIRQKLEPCPDRPRYLVNVRGLGYMLNRKQATAGSE
ncbi:MAG: response regulator transcription factor [Chloroflexi bacterium]|nr:response regulator transcription factor [Chloroflexota bacterium]